MFAISRRERKPLALLLSTALLLSLALSFTAPIPAAQAANANYFVDSVNGNDANSGTAPNSAWRSLNNINGRSFGPGDVINLARGSRWTGAGDNSAALTINGGGAAGQYIVVQPYGAGPSPILANPAGGDSVAIRIQAPWVLLQELVVRDARLAGVYLAGGADHAIIRRMGATHVGTLAQVESQYNLITGNNVHDLSMVVNDGDANNDYGATGVLLHASNNEVSYNRFVNCKAQSIDYGWDGGGVELFGTVDNTTIHHNYVNNAVGFIEVGGGTARNVTIAYNVIVNSGSVMGLHTGSNFGSQIDNLGFYNNTVVDLTQGYGLFYLDGGLPRESALQVRNNIFYVNNYGTLVQGYAPFIHDHNLYYFTGSQPELNFGFGPGERVADPMFANIGGGNYHPRAGAPGINAGAPAPYASDMDYRPVPSGGAADIGAYEFGQ
jgi:hypothetical protein